MPIARYMTVADVRLEGPPFNDAVTYPDAWVEKKIDLASEQIESFTGNWFESIERTGVSAIQVDGNRSNFLPLPFPIVYIDSITIIYEARYGADTSYEIDLTEVTVYNRHLTQGLVSPNDRKLPGISIDDFLGLPNDSLSTWPEGEQNVHLEGKFGWTSLAFGATVGETVVGSQIPQSEGVTPPLIERACMMLVRKYWPKMGDFHGMMSASKSIADITRIKVRDQEVNYSVPKDNNSGVMIGGTTGDADVDRILLDFKQTKKMKWA